MSIAAATSVADPQVAGAFPDHLVVRSWIVAGPFYGRTIDKTDSSAVTRTAYDHDYLTSIGGECRAELGFPQSIWFTDTSGARGIARTRAAVADEDGVVDFLPMFGPVGGCAAYAHAVIDVDSARTVYAFFGSDDSPRVWVNGTLVHELWTEGRGCNPYQDEFLIPLVKGRNRILVKVENGVSGWRFALNLFSSRERAEILLVRTFLRPSSSPDCLPPGVIHVKHDTPYLDSGRGNFCVYLPPNYEQTPDSFPVIYFLHGSGGDEFSDPYFSMVLHDMIVQKKVPPAIMVFPSICKGNYNDNGPGQMAESFFVKDLVPFVDKTFRTRATPSGRAITGFSMGGVGCLIMALKHPELFTSVVAFDGAGVDAGDLARANAEKILASGIKIKVRIGDSFGFVVEGAQKLRSACAERGIFVAFEEHNGHGHIEVIGGAAGKYSNFVKDPNPFADGIYFMFGAFRR